MLEPGICSLDLPSFFLSSVRVPLSSRPNKLEYRIVPNFLTSLEQMSVFLTLDPQRERGALSTRFEQPLQPANSDNLKSLREQDM